MKNKRTLRYRAFNGLLYVLFTLFTLICVFPFYYIFINTISENMAAKTGKVLFYPIGIHISNYIEVFKLRGLGNAAFISVARTVLGTFITLAGSSFLGFALGKKELWARKFWYKYIVVTMYFNAGIIPWFITMKNLHLTDNFLAYVLPPIIAPFYIILFKTYIESIPAELEESAQIDGAGYLTRYIRIIMPVSLPIIGTIAVFASVDQWNAFMDTLFLVKKSSLFTLQFVLYQYLHEVESLAKMMQSSMASRNIDPSQMLTPVSIRMTVSIVVVIPIILVYPFLQRLFVKGIMIGAIKG